MPRARRSPPSKAAVDAFGWHELLDRASLVADLFDRRVAEHPACVSNRALAREARAISDRLFEFYQRVGRVTYDGSDRRGPASGKR